MQRRGECSKIRLIYQYYFSKSQISNLSVSLLILNKKALVSILLPKLRISPLTLEELKHKGELRSPRKTHSSFALQNGWNLHTLEKTWLQIHPLLLCEEKEKFLEKQLVISFLAYECIK